MNVGTAYRNQNACKTFCHFIAEARRKEIVEKLSNAKKCSLLMDASTDTGNIDDEMFLVVWCDLDCDDEMVHTKMSYFAVVRPKQVDAQGLFNCLQSSLHRLGIPAVDPEHCKMLVGIGTDGASANIAGGGLRGLVEKNIPWLYWSWCLAHRIKLLDEESLPVNANTVYGQAINRLSSIFKVPLEAAGVVVGLIVDGFRRYLYLATLLDPCFKNKFYTGSIERIM